MEEADYLIPSWVDGLTKLQRVLFYCAWKPHLPPLKLSEILHEAYALLPSSQYHISYLINTINEMSLYMNGPRKLFQPIWDYDHHSLFVGCFPNQLNSELFKCLFTQITQAGTYLFNINDYRVVHDCLNENEMPDFLVPTIPIILVTGYAGCKSCCKYLVPKYEIRDVIDNIRRKLKGESMRQMSPCFQQVRCNAYTSTCTCDYIDLMKESLFKDCQFNFGDECTSQIIIERFYELKLELFTKQQKKRLDELQAKLKILKRYRKTFEDNLHEFTNGMEKSGFLQNFSSHIGTKKPTAIENFDNELKFVVECLLADADGSLLVEEVFRLQLVNDYYTMLSISFRQMARKTPETLWQSDLKQLEVYLERGEIALGCRRCRKLEEEESCEDGLQEPFFNKEEFVTNIISDPNLSTCLRRMFVKLKMALQRSKGKKGEKKFLHFWSTFIEIVKILVGSDEGQFAFNAGHIRIREFSPQMKGDILDGYWKEVYESLQCRMKLPFF